MNNTKKVKTIDTYEISLLVDDSAKVSSTQVSRLLGRSNEISIALRQAGINVINVHKKIEEIEPDIFIEDICRYTGYAKQTIYKLQHNMPIIRKGNKLTAKLSDILAWQNNR